MDQRTRERLPVLPTLVKTAADELKKAKARLAAVHATAPGTSFTVLGETYIKVKGTRYTDHAASATAYDANGRRHCLGPAEQRAFWAWGPWSSSATPEFVSRRCWRRATTASPSTDCRPLARSSLSCKSPPPRPTKNAFFW
ncbi:hypothetical protein [Streptomyces sp. BE133]|uniref:hypothetical protein n=1 Tax=Streptomyces sp. BE133 TaxID=3002523 RepID=UPI002E79402A|nr:hypothetical protein [Streptomyces sp. BE133]MEE1805126.1 hypothetical protein [Streptomyces sp. BE133]